ncbi:MAG: biosynthetic-type acetolactate synthase large subunit [Dehalococcoidia bacterium]|nr:biosynthetic-type acetolactate synthase large subunit [Dehalococcoidia bacterium]MCA9850258.1 biosynthetic-type acetolactate synthase large subunit [Dehalococcoidia bacterium]MCA9856335.1 biosynthetic-type acetolactate synthase large subunit [Dehalococcoidia bacterium]MCB9482769.1 biosynthetic-type acetolactate synthase large subunit [Dehalococcoidia bacterium]
MSTAPNGTRMSGADIVLECLKRLEVDTVFGYPGGAVLPLYDRIPAHPEIRHILVRHEQGGGHAADGYARASGKLGVAIGTSGPGATNLVTAITNAHMDSVPTLFLTGNVIRALIGRDGFQEADITGITMPTVKHNYLVMRASDIAPTIAEAAFLATTGRKGAVHVDIPKDVFIEEAEFNWPETISIRGYRVPGEADPEEVREAASIINNAERPVIFAGHGVIQADAAEDLRKFAEKGGIPILNTLLGLGSIPPEHALSYGMMGMHGSFWANHTASAADVIIALGMRMDDRALGRFQDMNPNATIIHVDIDPAEHGKNLPTAHPIVGDLAQVLPQLVEAIEPRTHVEWIRWIDNLRNEHRHSMSVPSGSELTQQYAISKIAEFAGPEAVLTTGVGQHQMWSAQFGHVSRPRQFITSGGLGTMGFEVPAAMGAQVACPDRAVWTICGDGGFQMTFQEIATMVDERLPVKMAIMNNGFLGMVRQWQELFHGNNYVAVHMSQPDFVKIAEAYGIRGIRVSDTSQVEDAIREAAEYPGPVILDFQVKAEDNVWPMVPAGAALNETIEGPTPVAR